MNKQIPTQPAADLMLICETDPASVATLQNVADRLGCDRIEISNPAQLDELLTVRRPTLAAIAMDSLQTDGLALLQVLARHDVRPATLLIGSQDLRVLTGVQRVAEARGLPVVGTRTRSLDEADVERLLLAHVHAPLPIARAELERAFAEHEFLLQYQPKVSLGADGMRVVGVEALVRWQHPRRGQLLPRHFLAAVESHGLMMQLTDVVITEAVRQAGTWNAQGLNLQVAINLSSRLVKDRAFPDRLAALLREYELAPAQVLLDVTETAGAQNHDLIQDVFMRLRVLGVGLSLDNFGTGLSSLSELYRMPFSEIKIDRQLLEDATHDGDAELIVRSIVSLAHGLRLTVCAEGVETARGLEFIRAAGFDSAQGRLFWDPAPPREIEQLMADMPQSHAAGTGMWRALRRRSGRSLAGMNPERAAPVIAVAS